jgi:hypothetical protein
MLLRSDQLLVFEDVGFRGYSLEFLFFQLSMLVRAKKVLPFEWSIFRFCVAPG